MSERKKVTINYYRLEAAEQVFYHDLADKLASLEDGGMDYGTFDGRSQELTFKIHEGISLMGGTRLFLVSLIKEKKFYPVRFDNEGNVQEPEPALGDIAYFLIDCDKQCFVSFGNMASGFADFARWLTDDQSAGISPIFKRDAVQTILQWEIIKKITFALKAENSSMWADAFNRIVDSHGLEGMQKSIYMKPYLDCGGIVDSMGGSGLEMTISNKKNLDKEFVRGFIVHMGSDGLFNKLKVTGKNFDEQSCETIDLCSAKVQHKGEIVVAGTHVSPDEARTALFEAYQINLDHIEAAIADLEGDE